MPPICRAGRSLVPGRPAGEVIEVGDDDELQDARPIPRALKRAGKQPTSGLAPKGSKGGDNGDLDQLNPSDDEVTPLAGPPRHLMKVTNRDTPINLADSDEEQEGPFRLTPSVRKPRLKPLISPVPKKRLRLTASERQPVAGPSRCQSRMDIDPDDSDAERIENSLVLAARAKQTNASLHIEDLLTNENSLAGPSQSRAPLSLVHSPPPPTHIASDAETAPSDVAYESFTTPEDFLPHVLAILPDLDATWALARLEVYIASIAKDKVVGLLVTDALDHEGGYPKAGDRDAKAGRIKAVVTTYADLVHRKEMRAGLQYAERTIAALQDHFPLMPAQHIMNILNQNARLYFPTFWVLREQAARHDKPYAELKHVRASKGAIPKRKGRGNAEDISASESVGPVPEPEIQDGGLPEWLREHEYLENAVERDEEEHAEEAARQAAHAAALAEGGGVECGCCFSDELVEHMFQCTEGHLFCKECCIRNAETKLGEQVFKITCMDMSSCSAPFPETELARALPAKSLELYFRLKVASELVLAGIEGLETCPACDYAVVIDNPDEKLFVCMAKGCMQISCRRCRKKEHLPKSCEEMEADRKLDKRHAIEDAMTAALVRKCPKCAKPYLKESGCNKITCSGCYTISCYICQQTIKDYSHFDHNPTEYGQPRATGKCHLWDHDEAMRDQEAIVRARDAARREVERVAVQEGIQLDEHDLDVAAPDRPRGASAEELPPADGYLGVADRAAREGRVRPHPFAAIDYARHRLAAQEMGLLLARENARNVHLRARAAFADRYGVEMAREPALADLAGRAGRAAPVIPYPGGLRAPIMPVPLPDPAAPHLVPVPPLPPDFLLRHPINEAGGGRAILPLPQRARAARAPQAAPALPRAEPLVFPSHLQDMGRAQR